MKNPNRQLGQYRRIIKTEKKLQWIDFAFWGVPALLLIASFVWQWHLFLKILSGIGVFTGIVGHWNRIERLRRFQEKAFQLESEKKPSNEPVCAKGLEEAEEKNVD